MLHVLKTSVCGIVRCRTENNSTAKVVRISSPFKCSGEITDLCVSPLKSNHSPIRVLSSTIVMGEKQMSELSTNIIPA